MTLFPRRIVLGLLKQTGLNWTGLLSENEWFSSAKTIGVSGTLSEIGEIWKMRYIIFWNKRYISLKMLYYPK